MVERQHRFPGLRPPARGAGPSARALSGSLIALGLGLGLSSLGSASCAAAGVVLGEGDSSSHTASSSSSSSSSSATASTTSTSGTGGAGGSTTSGTGGSGGSTTSGTSGAGGSGGSITGTGGTGGGSTTGAGGTGGSGGGTTAGTGGTGGSSGSSGSGGSGGAGGSPPTGVVVLLAGGGPAMLGAELHAGMPWTTTPINEATPEAPAIAMTSAAEALLVIRSSGSGGEVRVATWTPGLFSAFAALGAGITTRAAPHAIGAAGEADLIFHGDDFKHYFGLHQAMWSPKAEPVGGAAAQSFGPSPASITALGADRVACFAGQNGDLYDQTRSAGAWQVAHAHGLGNIVTLTPAIVAPAVPGLELLVVYVDKNTAKILYTLRAAGLWSAPAAVDPNSFTADPVALAPITGGAVMAFRGLDGKIYFSRFSAAAMPPWTPPAPLAQPNPTTPGAPALAPGIGGHDAELCFAGADGMAYHTRLDAQGFSAPVAVGGAQITRVALGSIP